jgi:hypothetical protein
MKIYGLDFTSIPGKKKPIVCAQCGFDGESLYLENVELFASFPAFEDFLLCPGPWLAGLDFPFGQSRKLVENIGWPTSWAGYVRYVDGMSKEEFVDQLAKYRQGRTKGDKQHLRQTDKLANSRSPMMLYGVPVGKMFFEGAPRLLNSGASILPCHPQDDLRILLEAYPALVARRWLKKRSYKNDETRKQTADLKAARKELLNGLCSNIKQHFGFELKIPENLAEASVSDGSGDHLDAILCAIQAAWAYTQDEKNYGIPADCDPLEGWIVDPLMRGSDVDVKHG